MKLGFFLYMIMLIAGAVQGILATDEAAKFVDAKTLWLWRSAFAVLNVTSTGLKAFTSESFSKWMELKKNGVKTGMTEFIAKNTGP